LVVLTTGDLNHEDSKDTKGGLWLAPGRVVTIHAGIPTVEPGTRRVAAEV
jgi:hypothetical protein